MLCSALPCCVLRAFLHAFETALADVLFFAVSGPWVRFSKPRDLHFATLGALRALQRGLAGGEKRPQGPDAILGLKRARPRRSLDDFGTQKSSLRAARGAPGEVPCHFSYSICKRFALFSKRRLRAHFRHDFGEAEKHQKSTIIEITKFATPPMRKR